MTDGIEYRTFESVTLDDATLVNGIPSVGLVSTIVANYVIRSMELEMVGAFESRSFPPTSLISGTIPQMPIRVYASSSHDAAVVLSEFNPASEQARPIAHAILDFAQNHDIDRVVSPEGIPYTEFEEETDDADIRDPRLFSVGSTGSAREDLREMEIPQLGEGMISGVGGVLLNEGHWRHFDVYAILAEAREKVPDARSAAKIIEVIDRFFPEIDVEAEPLYDRAEQIEARLKKAQARAQEGAAPKDRPQDIYR